MDYRTSYDLTLNGMGYFLDLKFWDTLIYFIACVNNIYYQIFTRSLKFLEISYSKKGKINENLQNHVAEERFNF